MLWPISSWRTPRTRPPGRHPQRRSWTPRPRPARAPSAKLMSSWDVLDAMELRLACMPCTSMSLVACLKESLRDVPAGLREARQAVHVGQVLRRLLGEVLPVAKTGRARRGSGWSAGRSSPSRFSPRDAGRSGSIAIEVRPDPTSGRSFVVHCARVHAPERKFEPPNRARSSPARPNRLR